jgi:hypothetical protein
MVESPGSVDMSDVQRVSECAATFLGLGGDRINPLDAELPRGVVK